jgi:hypothetical protein
MANYWVLVNKVIRQADVLLEVLDARMIEESRNIEIEEKVLKAGKKIIYVINKCDLADKKELERVKKTLRPSVFVSAKEHLGTSYLREEILKNAPSGEFVVGVLGYPNTGKSSLINVLLGRAVAKTSPVSGYTRGIQTVRISQRMQVIDTPGVLPYKEQDEAKHAMISAKTVGNLKDPEDAAIRMIGLFPSTFERYYSVEHSDDPEETLEKIALKLKKLRKGGLPDTHAAAMMLLRDWQAGKMQK